MFNAIAAGVAGVAMAAGSLGGLPVTEIGDEGWFEGGDRDSYSTTFTPDRVKLTGEDRVEMELTKLIGLHTLEDLEGLEIVGEGAVVKFPNAIVVDRESSRAGGTSMVFDPNEATNSQVHLTYYSAEDERMSVETFRDRIERGQLSGAFGGAITVGYTNTANEGSYTATIDTVTAGGTTWDFGTGVEAGPATKDDCKKGGWEDFDFKNQGQCIASLQGAG